MDAAARARELALLGIEVRATQSQNTGTGGGYTPPHVPAGNSKGGQFGTTAGTPTAGSGSGIGSMPQSTYKSGGGKSKSKAAAPANTPQAPTTSRTMKVGDSGEDVRYAQYAMNLLGFKVAQDGQYGPETEAAVKQMQERLGVAKPNGHLSPSMLHKMQDAVRLSPCVGAGQRDLAFETHWEARDVEDVDDDAPDEDTEALIAALGEFIGDDERSFSEALHPRNPKGSVGGGRFRSIVDRVVDALSEWKKGDGPDDPLKDFNRDQLLKAAKAHGHTFRRGASIEEIKAQILDDVRAGADAAKAEAPNLPGAPKDHRRFTIQLGGEVPATAERDLAARVKAINGIPSAAPRQLRTRVADELARQAKLLPDVFTSGDVTGVEIADAAKWAQVVKREHAGAWAAYSINDHKIYLHPDWATAAGRRTIDASMKKALADDHSAWSFPGYEFKNLDTAGAVIRHEMGHAVTDGMHSRDLGIGESGRVEVLGNVWTDGLRTNLIGPLAEELHVAPPDSTDAIDAWFRSGEVQRALSRQVSGYAAQNPRETLAELWAVHTGRGEEASPIAKRIGGIVQQRWEKKVPGGASKATATDVGIFGNPSTGKLSLYRESDTGKRTGRAIKSFDDMGALESWARDNGHTELADYAKAEQAKTGAPSAPAATKAAAFSADDVRRRLKDATTREAAREILQGLNVAQLKELAPDAGRVTTRKADLVDAVISLHSGTPTIGGMAKGMFSGHSGGSRDPATILSSLPADLTPAQKRARLRSRGVPKEQIDALVPLKAAKVVPKGLRPSGLPSDRKPESGDFDDLADRVSVRMGMTKEQRLEIFKDLNASELDRLARKFPGGAAAPPNLISGRKNASGLVIPRGLSLDQRRQWLADKLSQQRFHWRSRELALLGVTRALGHDVTPGHDELHHWWTRGPGLKLWIESPEQFRTLRAGLAKATKGKLPPEELDRMAAAWVHEVTGFWPGSDMHRVLEGGKPRGHRIGRG